MDATGVSGGSAIKRRFVRCGSRILHYRCAGQGPAVILLHDSPRSSRLHLATIERLSSSFRVYALDTPGYGNSEPLAMETPEIEHFAAALAEAIETLGLGDAPIYATHTSAKIAVEYAANHGSPPGLVLDGLSIPTASPNPAFIDTYMRPFVIEGTGGYLAAEWTRMRDMLRWFPWFDRRPETRMGMDMPSDEWIADYVIDHFSAGPTYSSAYRAAMYYDPMPALRSVKSPTLVGAREDDVLYAHLERVPTGDNDALRVERLGTDRETWLAWIEQALAQASVAGADSRQLAAQDSPNAGPVYVDLPHGQMLVHVAGHEAAQAPLLILDAPTTMQAHQWQQALGDRRTLVPELPGFGESDAMPEMTLEAVADALAAALGALRIETADVLALGFATSLATSLAARHPQLVRKVVLDGCFDLPDDASVDFAARLCPPPKFDRAGAHLHRAWHMLRDTTANWPWFAQEAGARRDVTVAIEPQALHGALVGVLKQPETYGDVARAACLRAAAERYAPFEQPALVFERATDPAYAAASQVAERLKNGAVAARAADPASSAEPLCAFLDAGDAA